MKAVVTLMMSARANIQRFLYAILGVLDGIFKLVIPPSNQYISYLSSPDYSDNSYYLYKHALRTRRSLCHVWLLKNNDDIGRIFKEFGATPASFGHRLKVFRKRSLPGYYYFLRSRSVFHTHGVYPFVRGAYRREVVNLWHGMPIKCIGALNTVTPNPHPTFGTRHIATSHFFKYIIAQAFSTTAEHVQVCALPRCDAFRLEPDSILEMSLRNQLNIGDEYIVAWLPTYRSEGEAGLGSVSFLNDLDGGGLQVINGIAQKNNCVIVIKLHPYDPLNYEPDSDDYSNIRWVKASKWQSMCVQLYDFLAITNGLISDISSVVFDYHSTNKPIGLLKFNAEAYSRALVYPIDMLKRSKRFHYIEDESQLNLYLSDVSNSHEVEYGAEDLIHAFVEDHAEMGSEAVLRASGL